MLWFVFCMNAESMDTMKYKRIVSESDSLYSGCVRIYEESFPYAERRDTSVMTQMLHDPRFHFLAFYDGCEDNGPIGFFTFWDFGHGYLYGEHFAVDPSRRGGGTGTRILDCVKSLGVPVILEIETPSFEDGMTMRRKLFYERNGFIVNPHKHVQPAYHTDSGPVPMKVMSWPYVFSVGEYRQFRSDQLDIMPAL